MSARSSRPKTTTAARSSTTTTTAAYTSKVASAAPELPKPEGKLDPDVIQKIVRDNFDGMKKCYEEGLGRNPSLKGKVATRFVIESDGHVSSAVENPNDLMTATFVDLQKDPQGGAPEKPLADAKVTDCVVSKFAMLTFPKPEGGAVTVVYPIVFRAHYTR